MSGRYGYEDRREYRHPGGAGSWGAEARGLADRADREREWDHQSGGRDWDRGGGGRDSNHHHNHSHNRRGDWDGHAHDRRQTSYDPPLPSPHPPRDVQWERPRGGSMREDWPPPPRDRDIVGPGPGGPPGPWNRGPPPPPASQVDRDLYADRESVVNRGVPVERLPPPIDWDGPNGPPPRGVARKRDNDMYDDRDYGRDHRFGARGSADDPDWKRRKVDLDEFEKGGPPLDKASMAINNGYNDRDDPRYVESEQGPRRRMEHSEPSQHVIFLGLDQDFSEADLRNYLTTQGHIVDSVTIIRDRNTGYSRGFGFAQFPTVASASGFVVPNFPFIHLPPPALQPNQVGPTGQPGRRCKIDFSQSPHPSQDPSANGPNAAGAARSFRPEGGKPQPKNDGTRDIGSAPRPVVLLRSLDKSSDIDEIADAVRKAEGPNKLGAAGMKRILLVKDRASGNSLGFAFVEMFNTETASSLLAGIMNPTLHPTGFRINNSVIAASFALPYAFQLLPPGALRDDACVTPSAAIGGVDEDGLTRYWDESAILEEKQYEVIMSQIKPEPEEPTAQSGSLEPKDATSASLPPAPTALPLSSGPVSLKFKSNKTSDKAESKPGAATGTTAPSKLGFSADADVMDVDEDGDAEDAAAPANAQANEGKGTAKVAPMIGSSKIAKDINKWNQAKEEANEQTQTQSAVSGTSTTAQTAAESKPAPADVLKPGDPGYEYGDPVALTCLLCLRQLKSLNQLQRHNSESEMHKHNLKDPEKCRAALEKVTSVRTSFLNGTPRRYGRNNTRWVHQHPDKDSETVTKYRDRASERRRVHNQPEVPLPPTQNNSRFAEGPAPPTPSEPAAPAVELGKDEGNIGNILLKKMGWSEGAGLGIEGDGRAEPIKTAVYASGAGIGASKGKEVTGFTGASYGDAAKDAARDRYESSS